MTAFLVVLVVSLLNPDATLAFGWNWLLGFATTTTTSSTTSSSTSSGSSNTAANNYQLSIGNRMNTTAGATDYGTTITDLNINLARFNGSGIGNETALTLLDDAVLSVAEEYRNESIRVIAERLAWFDDQIAEANVSANGVHRQHIGDLVREFANDTRSGIRGLDNTTRDCLSKASVEVEDVIRSVEQRSESGCLGAKIQRMEHLRMEANRSLTEFLENQHDVEDRLEICADLQDDFSDDMSDFYKVACVSSVLFDVQAETAKLELEVEALTTDAGVTLRQLKAGLLECVVDVANYAFDASLKLRHWINVCAQ